MSRQIIENLAKDKELMEVCKKITGNSYLWEDLFQDTMTILFEKPKEIIEESFKNGKIKAFAIKVMLNHWSNMLDAQRRINAVEYVSSHTPIPQFTGETITTNINHWKAIIDEQGYFITEINPESIKVVKVLELMRETDKNKGSGFHYRTTIFNEYLRLGSARAVGRYMNIHYLAIHREILAIKKLIRQAK